MAAWLKNLTRGLAQWFANVYHRRGHGGPGIAGHDALLDRYLRPAVQDLYGALLIPRNLPLTGSPSL